MTVLYPIAASPEAALNAPSGRAAREGDARALAGAEVEFVRELTGPALPTREAALEAYAGRVDVEKGPQVAPQDRYCEVMEVIASAKAGLGGGGQAEPTYAKGRRWPKPARPLKTAWRLSVAYWRPVTAEAAEASLDQARQARRDKDAGRLDPKAVQALARQPLRPVRPQQPLDTGLFETRPPEAPHIVMPDE